MESQSQKTKVAPPPSPRLPCLFLDQNTWVKYVTRCFTRTLAREHKAIVLCQLMASLLRLVHDGEPVVIRAPGARSRAQGLDQALATGWTMKKLTHAQPQHWVLMAQGENMPIVTERIFWILNVLWAPVILLLIVLPWIPRGKERLTWLHRRLWTTPHTAAAPAPRPELRRTRQCPRRAQCRPPVGRGSLSPVLTPPSPGPARDQVSSQPPACPPSAHSWGTWKHSAKYRKSKLVI